MLEGHPAVWTIFDHPRDYPDKFVVAVDVIRDGGVFRRPERWLADSLERAREIIATNDPTASSCLDRDPSDDPCIVETWL